MIPNVEKTSLVLEQNIADHIFIHRTGHTVGFRMDGLKSLQTGNTVVCNTPSFAVPIYPVYEDFDITRVDDVPVKVRVYIGNEIRIYNYGNAITKNSNIQIYISYPCN